MLIEQINYYNCNNNTFEDIPKNCSVKEIEEERKKKEDWVHNCNQRWFLF